MPTRDIFRRVRTGPDDGQIILNLLNTHDWSPQINQPFNGVFDDYVKSTKVFIITNSIERMSENIPDEKVDVICLYWYEASKVFSCYQHKGVTHHLQQIVELLLDETDIHPVGNYCLAGAVWGMMTVRHSFLCSTKIILLSNWLEPGGEVGALLNIRFIVLCVSLQYDVYSQKW